MSKAGHHNTTVHESVAPAVTHETINPQREERVTTAIDKETHQDHYHTSVQPVQDREILPEQHTHNLAAVEHRNFEHGNQAEVEARLKREAAQFRDTREVMPTHETRTVSPTIAGEHVHHHVHETIQPVVQKEVIAPSVVHTTVPIHEVHHNAAQHHSASALPAVSMADFKKAGGVLEGRGERYDAFEGEPRSVGGALGGGAQTDSHNGSNSNTTTGHRGASTSGYGSTGAGYGAAGGAAAGSRRRGSGSSSSSDEGRGKQGKPSMMDKLNPKVDADGDGKAGMMS
ncbi:hypothetical protein LTS18_006067 [Coniosporium uncinatum]|uniref:Uncharacterized protein n=1 Tax=Coniosporium uncinatum TaxID=93489 RepID=A0ACC3DQL2_9PEZI|nr:hypothetical protein LTS18_006067 [Coniosporium uncinatum]